MLGEPRRIMGLPSLDYGHAEYEPRARGEMLTVDLTLVLIDDRPTYR
jgi:hypothetical protein